MIHQYRSILHCPFAICLMTIPLFGQWQSDYRLTIDPNESRCATSKAVAANGPALHIVWFDNRDGNQEIYYKSSSDTGATWNIDARLTNNVSNSQTPRIAISGTNLHVVWQDNRDGNYEVYYKRSTDNGANWESDTRLTSNSAWSLFPTLAIFDSNIYVLWMDDRDGNREAYFKRSSDNGTTWSSDLRLSNDADWTWSPALAVSADTIHAVWYESDAGGNLGKEIHYARSTNMGVTWDAPIMLTNDPAVSMGPAIAASGSKVHVTWEDNRDGNYEIYYKRSTDNGVNWEPDTRLTSYTGASTGSSIDVSSSNVHVVWTDERDYNSEIYYKSSADNGVSWSMDTRLTNNSATSFYNSISVSGPAVHAVWYDNRDGNWEIYYKRNPTGNVFVEEQESGIKPRTLPSAPTIFRDQITIMFARPLANRVTIRLYDIAGKLVLNENYGRQPAFMILQGDKVRVLNRGVYILSVTSDRNRIAIIKLIKI